MRSIIPLDSTSARAMRLLPPAWAGEYAVLLPACRRFVRLQRRRSINRRPMRYRQCASAETCATGLALSIRVGAKEHKLR